MIKKLRLQFYVVCMYVTICKNPSNPKMCATFGGDEAQKRRPFVLRITSKSRGFYQSRYHCTFLYYFPQTTGIQLLGKMLCIVIHLVRRF